MESESPSAVDPSGGAPVARLKQRLPDALLLLGHLLALCVLSAFAFRRNRGLFFLGNDGPSLVSFVLEQLDFSGVSAAFHAAPLQGLGDLSGSFNLTALAPFWRSIYNAEGIAEPVALHSFFAVAAFVTVLLVGWNHRFPRGISYAAAWALTILILPYFDHFRVYPVTASAPQFLLYLLAAALADVGIWRMGREGWVATARHGALLLLAILLMLVLSPSALVLLVPYLLLAFVVALCAAPPDERRRKLWGAVAVVAIAGALGWIEYAAGMALYTNFSFFPKDMVAAYPPDRQFASILFQGKAGADRAIGPWFYGLAAFGAALALRAGRRGTHFFPALTQLIGQAALAGVGGWLMVTIVPWTGPPFIYCEMMFFALYALFAVQGIAVCCRAAGARLEALPPGLRGAIVWAMPVVAAALVAAAMTRLPGAPRRGRFDYALPPSSTPLTQALEGEIRLGIGKDFAGRVANIIPFQDRDRQFPYFRYLNVLTGNDHQTTGLWLKDIPTLHAYGQFISPAFHSVIRSFLATPGELQHRSWTNFSELDYPILRLFGVRFILTTEPFLPNAARRGGLNFSAMQPVPPLYLHELGGANVAGISAARALTARSIGAAEDLMAGAGFDPRVAIVMDPAGAALAQAEVLRPAISSRISVEKGAWRIRAQSDGWTLLVLPIEFSRCMDVVPATGVAPRVLRTDIALTGLLFEREADVRLVNRIGPFAHPRCRLRDFRDFRALWQAGTGAQAGRRHPRRMS
ncbi:MAG TPA: hypothetical protein VN317_02870, partial [Candidatus Methanoperedens sp.]|nr:hypothetical protein [Candidatus Methanoperedens sp.]